MRLLLDTHIWLWSLLEPQRLSPTVLEKLRSPDTRLHLSPISIWETTLLVAKNRIALDRDVNDWIGEALSRVPIAEVPLTVEAALEAHRLNLPHRDPADRFIVATARAFDLTLVTADIRILSSGLCDLLSNA